MARPKHKLHFKEKLSYKKYLKVLKYLDEKSIIIAKKKNPTVKLELNTIANVRASIFLLMHTGLRVSEIRLIKNEDILRAVKEQEFWVYEPKKKGMRRVELSNALSEIFKEFFKEYLNELKNENYIIRIYNKPTTPLSQNYLQVLINRHLKDALGAGHTTHGFRRYIITRLIKIADAKKAQVVANHKDIATTMLYLNVLEKGDAGKALESLIENERTIYS